MSNATDKANTINAIAAKHEIETLETRSSDSLDFHDIAVWQIKEMLNAAYDAGQRSAARGFIAETQAARKAGFSG